MLIGAQVRTGGRLPRTFERAEAIRADDVQVFLQNPQGWMPPRYPPEELARFSSARTEHPRVARTYCHALYLINLATSDAALLERFRCALVANLAAVQAIGASGLVVHVGSHLGRGFDAAASQMVDELLAALDAASGSASSPGAVERRGAGCSVLIENPAGGGGSIGGQFEELADLVERADADDALGACIATQHLWTFGVPFGSLAEADDVVAASEATMGLGALRCVHPNDSKAVSARGSIVTRTSARGASVTVRWHLWSDIPVSPSWQRSSRCREQAMDRVPRTWLGRGKCSDGGSACGRRPGSQPARRS